MGIGDDASYSLGGSDSSLPALGAQIGNDTSEKVEQILGVLLLDIGKLVRRGISD